MRVARIDGLTCLVRATIPGGQTTAAAISFITTNLNANAYTWTVNLPTGLQITLKITDAAGNNAYTSPLTVSSSTPCDFDAECKPVSDAMCRSSRAPRPRASTPRPRPAVSPPAPSPRLRLPPRAPPALPLGVSAFSLVADIAQSCLTPQPQRHLVDGQLVDDDLVRRCRLVSPAAPMIMKDQRLETDHRRSASASASNAVSGVSASASSVAASATSRSGAMATAVAGLPALAVGAIGAVAALF